MTSPPSSDTPPALATAVADDHPTASPPEALRSHPAGAISRGERQWPRGRFGDWRDVLAVLIVALAFTLPLRTLFRYQGPPMEEGFMLVFPERVLAGDIPNKDFLHLYGPGSLWASAAWYRVAGVSLAAERLFGLVQLAGIVFGVMALARPWGRRVMVASGLIGVLLTTTAIGLTALAWNGAVALAVAALWVALRARRWSSRPLAEFNAALDVAPAGEAGERRIGRLLVLSGVLAGLALLFRPDLVIAVTLGTVAALAGLGWARWRRWLAGAAAGVAPYLVHLALAGPGNVVQGMLIDPVFELRAGRSLPRPPSWGHFDGALQKVAGLRVPGWDLPSPTGPQQVFLWFFLLPVVAVGIVLVGWWRVRAEPDGWRPRVLLAGGLLGLGMMPQALQRADTTHLAWVSCGPLALLPAALTEVAAHLPARAVRRHAGTVAAILALMLPLAVLPHFSYRPYLDLVNQGRSPSVFGYEVSYEGRRFYLGARAAVPAAQAVVERVGRDSEPGQRLFVGTADLRKTPYSDAYLYYLLADLVPATRYIEMDPMMANAPGSGLDRDVASADWLILSHVWDNWEEPNASLDLGSDAPNQVVRDTFCPVGDYAPYFEVYRRCDAK